MPSQSNHTTCKAAVFSEVGRPIELQRFDLPSEIEPGAALCRVIMSTICGSDLHTIHGRRTEPTPLILGHEIIGEVVALGDEMTHDGFGDPLGVGDRVSWSIMACCRRCFFCRHGLPQKCVALRKYGHRRCTERPHLTGGFAEYIYLAPGTAVFRIPDGLSDEIATPANCALSTAVNAAETIGLAAGQTALVQGAGLLGLNLIALCRQAGVEKVIVTDISAARLDLAKRFGADACFNITECSDDDVLSAIGEATDGRGADVAFEVCGRAEAVSLATAALRTGGGYLIAGMVSPGQVFRLEGNQVTRKCLTIKGVHNYRPEHLGEALKFLASCAADYPYDEIVSRTFALDDINTAVAAADNGTAIRVAVRP